MYIDLHQDLMLHLTRREYFGDLWQTNFKQLTSQNFKLVVASVFVVPPRENYFDPQFSNLISAEIDKYHKAVENKKNWLIVKDNIYLKKIINRPEQKGLLLHMEGLNVFSDNNESWSNLELWFEKGLRSVGPFWNLSNSLGGGTHDSASDLTDLGKKLIIKLNQKKIIVDFAHMNEPTFWSALKISSQPVIVSHAAVKKLCPSSRNLSDQQIKAIAASGGVIGIFLSNKFISQNNTASVSDVANHFDYIKNLVGIEHLALGSDWGGILSGLPKKLGSVEEVSNLFEELKNRGYSKTELEKIKYKNALRVISSIIT